MWCVMRVTSWHRDKCDDGHSHPGQQLSCQLSQNSIRWSRVKNNLWSHSSEIGAIAPAGDSGLGSLLSAHLKEPPPQSDSSNAAIGRKVDPRFSLNVTQKPNTKWLRDIFKARPKVFLMLEPGVRWHHAPRGPACVQPGRLQRLTYYYKYSNISQWEMEF